MGLLILDKQECPTWLESRKTISQFNQTITLQFPCWQPISKQYTFSVSDYLKDHYVTLGIRRIGHIFIRQTIHHD